MNTSVIAKKTRWYRKLHRWIASVLFAFFLLISITGLLLAWKKNTGGYLLAKTYEGSSKNLSDWLPLDSLQKNAVVALRTEISPDLPAEIDRIDVRPDKGMVKVTFRNHYWAVQLDGATGNVLHLERRRADFIEHLHDGSLFDRLAGTSGLKITYSSIMGLALLLLTISGFWLWYNPKRIRKKKPAA
jgi:uncharacterized iron-regulated membrane protein